MNTCPYCEARTRPGDQFCLHCGNRLPMGGVVSAQASLAMEQSSAGIPAGIGQLAEAQRMGELIALHQRQYRNTPILSSCGITSLVGFMIFAFVLFPLLASGQFALLMWPLLAYPLLLALLYGGLYLRFKRRQLAHRQDQIALYAEGFIVLDSGIPTAYRWENLASIQRGVPLSEGEGIGDIDQIEIKTFQKTTFRLYPTMPASARADICDRIERGFVSSHLPHVIAEYNAGQEVVIHTLVISQTGIRDTTNNDTERLPWPLVEKAEVDSTRVSIRKEGRTSDWYHSLICTFPNAALLKALLEYRQESRPANRHE